VGVESVNLNASDPWKKYGSFLTLENHRQKSKDGNQPAQKETTTITGRGILLELSAILKAWPGEETGILSDEARHMRFVLAVAGYPEIEISTRPLDWPLHPKSIDALQVSNQLDSIVGATEGTSLRSSILNRDFNYRNPNNNHGEKSSNNELMDAHKDCLSLLFTRLRQIDKIKVNLDYFQPEELQFLTILHSNDNNRRNCWPKIKGFEGFKEFAKPQGEKPDMEAAHAKYGEEHPVFKDLKRKNIQFVKWENLNNKFNLPLSQSKNDINDGSFVNITFQFHYIQTFFDKMIPKQSFTGTIQRFYRGYSMLLELLTSEVVQIVANEVGIGSILIHGGGRVSFLCPKDKKNDMLNTLKNSKTEFLNLTSKGKNERRIRSTLDKWAEACVVAGQLCSNNANQHGMICEDCKFCKECAKNIAGGKKHPNQDDYEMWFKELCGFLPPISIRETSVPPRKNGEQNSDNKSILKEIYDLAPQQIGWLDENCQICNMTLNENQIKNIDGWMGLNDVSSSEKIACSSHRLFYFLGHDQRLKDSVLRQFNHMSQDEPDDGTKNRTVTSICMLDANSLGVIFSERYWTDMENDFCTFYDRQRRRSFQFNVHWWTSIFDSIKTFGSNDSIAAWITAGDDVLLAQYQLVGNEPSDNLEKMIKELAKRIQWEIDEGIFLSFGAGISRKIPEVMDGILQLIKRAKFCESISKEHWKQKAFRVWTKMMVLPANPNNSKSSTKDGMDVNWEEDKHQEVFIEGSHSTLVLDNNINNTNSNKNENDKEYLIPNDMTVSIEEITQSIEVDIKRIEERMKKTIDFRTYTQRSYVRKNLYIDEEKLIILPPK
jgi:hypothetical protein